MNERIQKLYVETTGKDWVYDFDPDYAETFAELIVRECIEVVKWTPSQFPNDEYVKNIKERFGVEE